jgi:hypothetical protein
VAGRQGEKGIADLSARADEVLVAAVGEAFRTAFLIAGALALLGAVALVAQWASGRTRRSQTALIAAAATLVGLPVAYVVLHGTAAPDAIEIQDPCEPRDLPSTGGIEGFLQDRALELLDTTACKAGSSREELVLAIADDAERRRYEAKHDIDPRSIDQLRDLLG